MLSCFIDNDFYSKSSHFYYIIIIIIIIIIIVIIIIIIIIIFFAFLHPSLVIVGNTVGTMGSIDLRKGKYKCNQSEIAHSISL